MTPLQGEREGGRGAKTQNFPDSNYLCAKAFQTKWAKLFLTTSLKSALLPPPMEGQQFSPNRAKNGVCVLNMVKNGPKGHKMDPKGLKYMKKGFMDQKYLFFVQLFQAEF